MTLTNAFIAKAFNRTIVELKRDRTLSQCRHAPLLIEPLWN